MSTFVRRPHGQEDSPDPSRPEPSPLKPISFQAAQRHWNQRGGLLSRDGVALAADHATRALAALDTMSRRMDDLARELNCLGYFDDDDRPRAA